MPAPAPPRADAPASPHAQAVPEHVLDACAREPIHAPGAIQPAGILLGVEPRSGVVEYASANAAAWLGRDASAGDPIGQTLGALLGEATARQILGETHEAAAATPGAAGTTGRGPAAHLVSFGGRDAEAIVSRSGQRLHVELLEGESAAHVGAVALRVQSALARAMSTASVEEACQQIADEVRGITGFGRVKVYRFDEDWNGAVVAEARDPDMESYLGLHFPASDIPPQARALYARVPTRAIADVDYVPVPLVGAATGEPGQGPDLSESTLRSVSPVHLDYLRNMDVRASMSVSIMRGGVLWGLIACHHRTPLHCSYHTQAACAVLAQMLGLVIERDHATGHQEMQQARQASLARLVDGLLRTDEVMAGLRQNADALLGLVGAHGAALIAGDTVDLVGVTPGEAAARELAGWIQEIADDGVYATAALFRDRPGAEAIQETASGVLGVTLARRSPHIVLWFRPEEPQTVTWAGAPTKDVRSGADGTLHLHPRASFEAWRTLRRGQARPWTDDERAAAATLRGTIQDLVYERLDEIQRLNRRLSLANTTLEERNRELQDFAYIASHDLREPLRKVRAFADLVLRDYGERLPEEGKTYLRRIEVAGERMTRLVADLLVFSRVVTHGGVFEPVDLRGVVRDVLVDLDLAIEQSGAVVEASGPWPALVADAAQVGQLLRLLVENAIKFRAPGRPARIHVSAAEEGSADGRTFVVLRVRDNGLGLDAKYARRIFQPFERLYAREAFSGTGMGLAIGRRIAERHGGRIAVTSAVGEGATFEVHLPQPPPDPERGPDDETAPSGPSRPPWPR